VWCLGYILSFGWSAQATQKLSYFILFTPILDPSLGFLLSFTLNFSFSNFLFIIYHCFVYGHVFTAMEIMQNLNKSEPCLKNAINL